MIDFNVAFLVFDIAYFGSFSYTNIQCIARFRYNYDYNLQIFVNIQPPIESIFMSLSVLLFLSEERKPALPIYLPSNKQVSNCCIF